MALLWGGPHLVDFDSFVTRRFRLATMNGIGIEIEIWDWEFALYLLSLSLLTNLMTWAPARKQISSRHSVCSGVVEQRDAYVLYSFVFGNSGFKMIGIWS